MIVVVTDEADADLERIGDFIAPDNPRQPITFFNELIDRCRRLADTPRGFRLVPRYEHTGVWRRSYGEYLIFYRVGADRIDVLHVLNGAQDYDTILFPKERSPKP